MPSLTKSINRGVEYLQQGRAEKAADLYRDVLLRSPNNPDALHLLAVAVYQLGDPASAAGYAERAIASNPNSADYHNNLGQYYLSLNRAREAADSLERALRLSPSHPMARLNLSSAFIAQGRREEALCHLADYVRMEPDNPVGHMALGNLYAEMNRHQDAAACYVAVLSIDGGIAEAHNNLGNASQALGQLQDALTHYEAALALRSNYPDAWSNKGAALQALGRLEEAAACFCEALNQDPRSVQARGNLGNLLGEQGRHEEALALYQDILATSAASVETWNNLGNCHQQLGRHAEALEAYRKALELRPSYYLVHNNIGNTLRRLGRYQDACSSYLTALAADANFVEAMNNLGVALQDQGRLIDAVPWFEKAQALRPSYVDPYINLANNWRDRGRPEQAILYLRRALELAPKNPHIWNNLGCALGDQGVVKEAIACYRKTLELTPGNHLAHSNLLLNMHYMVEDPKLIAEAHHEFARIHEASRAKYVRSLDNSHDANRQLRIGYVSADFRRHSVAFFLEPVLERHNKEKFAVFQYADVTRPDGVTQQFQALAGDRWRDLRGMNASDFADLVRSDGIDILIDLGGHTANSRLLDFAARPAPVQISWLGYPDTSGLQCIGHRLTDAWADPPGLTERFHTENLVRLSNGFLCFRPASDAPAVAPMPSLSSAPFTFGSFNNMAKIGAESLALWAEILHRVPNSRIAIKNKALSEAGARQRLIDNFSALGIPQHRVYMAGLIDSLVGHLEAYGTVDLGLDTWPYHGATTTCEALWMGVPVVTLAGNIHVSRVGVSIMHAAGLARFVAQSSREYVDLAVELSSHLAELSGLRIQMRNQLLASSLLDEAGFTRDLEAAYRRLWGQWCGRPELQNDPKKVKTG